MKPMFMVPVAVGVGYVLGRTHKLKFALALGAAAATGKLAGSTGELIQRGTKALTSSPEFSKVTDPGGQLMQAAKAAAMAALTSRLDTVSDRLHERAEGMRAPATPGAEAAKGLRGQEPEEQEQEEGTRKPRGRRAEERRETGRGKARPEEEQFEEYEEEDYPEQPEGEFEEEEEPEEQPRRAERRTPAPAGGVRRGR